MVETCKESFLSLCRPFLVSAFLLTHPLLVARLAISRTIEQLLSHCDLDFFHVWLGAVHVRVIFE